MSDQSIGIVTPTTHHFDQPIKLSCGRILPSYSIIYETYGTLNAAGSNAVLICHALTGNHHAAGYHSPQDKKPGWWDSYIGPGKPIDSNRFFIVSLNNIGGCAGSTGPTSINPATKAPWGADFPTLRCRDWVNTQRALMKVLGITQWTAVIGGSLGGMQAMRWSLMYPDEVHHCIVIASAMKLTAQNIAFNEVARQAIRSDSEFHEGHYLGHHTTPQKGLRLARMIGHLTYLSESGMGQKFGRHLKVGHLALGEEPAVEFQIESYLRYQGDAFAKHFDANTYMLMTRALDYFDLAREYNDDPIKAFSHAQCAYLVISFTSDWRFPPARSQAIVNALIAAKRPVSYVNIDANDGHDAFLKPNPRYQVVLSAYMHQITIKEIS